MLYKAFHHKDKRIVCLFDYFVYRYVMTTHISIILIMLGLKSFPDLLNRLIVAQVIFKNVNILG